MSQPAITIKRTTTRSASRNWTARPLSELRNEFNHSRIWDTPWPGVAHLPERRANLPDVMILTERGSFCPVALRVVNPGFTEKAVEIPPFSTSGFRMSRFDREA
jgi:hypothetical protein